MDTLIDRLDETGKGAWIALMVISFIVFWPIGLAVLFYMIWSGRMGNWNHAYAGNGQHKHWGNSCSWGHSRRRKSRRSRHAQSSGNSAFDAYREEVIKRLEEEQVEFENYLERLRQAKDKEEFEAFVADRKAKGAIVPDPGSSEPDSDEETDTSPQQ